VERLRKLMKKANQGDGDMNSTNNSGNNTNSNSGSGFNNQEQLLAAEELHKTKLVHLKKARAITILLYTFLFMLNFFGAPDQMAVFLIMGYLKVKK
jgi:hypothetical protein